MRRQSYDLNYIALDGSDRLRGQWRGSSRGDRWRSSSSTAPSRRTSSSVGGGATKEKVTAAFKIIFADQKVKGILVNISRRHHGKWDIIAEGVVAAVKEVGLQVPLVVRLEGTNVDLGKKILSEIPDSTFSRPMTSIDAAQKIVPAVKG